MSKLQSSLLIGRISMIVLMMQSRNSRW
uniref:Uncharacterized protein n=1 Tax=Arundo donax TaxID=35708 RepID=A0A0A8XQN7_ARUDO